MPSLHPSYVGCCSGWQQKTLSFCQVWEIKIYFHVFNYYTIITIFYPPPQKKESDLGIWYFEFKTIISVCSSGDPAHFDGVFICNDYEAVVENIHQKTNHVSACVSLNINRNTNSQQRHLVLLRLLSIN